MQYFWCSECPGMQCMLSVCIRHVPGQQQHVSKALYLTCTFTGSKLHLAVQLILLLAQLSVFQVQLLPTLLGTVQLLPVLELEPLLVPAQQISARGWQINASARFAAAACPEGASHPTRVSSTPSMSSSLVSFASLDCTLCLSSRSFPYASSSRFSFASSCIFSSMAMALLVLA